MSKPTQAEIPGTEAPKIKAIENAAQSFVEARGAFQNAAERLLQRKTKLIEVCQQNQSAMGQNADGDYVYKYDDLLVILSDKINVKVKAAKEPHFDDKD